MIVDPMCICDCQAFEKVSSEVVEFELLISALVTTKKQRAGVRVGEVNGREHRGEEHNGTQRARATWVGGRWRRHKRLSVTRRAGGGAQIERLAEEESCLLSVTYAWCTLHNSMTIFKYLRPKLHFSDTRQISSLWLTIDL